MRGLAQAVAISYMPQNKEIPTVAMLLRNDDLLYMPKVYNSEILWLWLQLKRYLTIVNDSAHTATLKDQP